MFNMQFRYGLTTLIFLFILVREAPTYPIDGYTYTNIRRLDYLQSVVDEEIKGTKPIPGAMKKTYEIQLNLDNERGDQLANLPAPDPDLQKAINSLFPRLNENYSIALLDI